MKITVTYVHHNCFVLKTDTRTFLFDYPSREHLPEGAESVVRKAVAGTDLAVFTSHSHEDHLGSDLGRLGRMTRSVHYVFSDDVEEMRPETIPTDENVLIVEPDGRYAFDRMTIETLMSNDLGVAFMITDGDFRLYYGGDLAKWIWESASEQEAAFTADYFRKAMERVRDFRPHVAFSNLDKRLPNLAGGDEACRIIDAPVFVPMHTFGQTGWLDGFRELAAPARSELFVYAASGESRDFVF